MPQIGDIWESYRADEFVLWVGSVPSPSVTRISGLSLGEFDTIEQPDAGTSHVFKISSTKVTFPTLTVERRVDGSEDDTLFQEWFQETFNFEGAPRGSAVRRNGMIQKLHDGEVVMELIFKNAWIKSVSFSDFEAGSSSLMTQTVQLEHEGLELTE